MVIEWNRYKRDFHHLGLRVNLEDLPQPCITCTKKNGFICKTDNPEFALWMKSDAIKTIKEINDPILVNNYILTYTIPDDKQIFLVGDLHGNYKRFKEELLENDYRDCVFIMLGDQVMLYDD